MLNTIIFFVIITIANIIQGVTGFAGTILAMPASLMLVGYETAVPVLNLLGLLSGIYVFVPNIKKVSWGILLKILLVMLPMIFVGIYIEDYLKRFDHAVYIVLGVIVLTISVVRMTKMVLEDIKNRKSADSSGVAQTKAVINSSIKTKLNSVVDASILILAGIVHGMFVCGGPLLISYLTKRIEDSASFRATISTVWIVLNGIILISHISSGMWGAETIRTGALAVPFLIAGMFIGSVLYRKMSRKTFMIMTYVLLFISGISLLVK